jgi:hypothetical protein
MLRWLKTVVVSDEEKAPVEASGGDREGERKRIVADVVDAENSSKALTCEGTADNHTQLSERSGQTEQSLNRLKRSPNSTGSRSGRA